MKKIYLMKADGKFGQGSEYHLFLWDSTLGELKKIAEGAFAKEFRNSSHVLLGNDESDLQVYQVCNNALQIVPVHSKNVEFINGIICCEQEKQWYAFFKDEKVQLGERRQLPLSFASSAKLGTTELDYFILNRSEHEFLLSFIVNAVLMQGSYSIKHLLCGDYILAMRSDGNYDIYKAGVPYIYDPEMYHDVRPYVKDNDNWIYFWDEVKTSWRRLASDACFVIADNALIEHCFDPKTNKHYDALYKVEGVIKTEIRRGKYELFSNCLSFEIGGMIYSINYDRRLVDFDSPRSTFKQKIKNLFNYYGNSRSKEGSVHQNR